MVGATYYLVNHTKKEFCYYNNQDKSIFAELERTYKRFSWSNTDDIRVRPIWKHHINDPDFKNMDYVSEGGGIYKFPRRFSKAYCKKTLCSKMGFTQRASCRPYKNCYKKTLKRIS